MWIKACDGSLVNLDYVKEIFEIPEEPYSSVDYGRMKTLYNVYAVYADGDDSESKQIYGSTDHDKTYEFMAILKHQLKVNDLEKEVQCRKEEREDNETH